MNNDFERKVAEEYIKNHAVSLLKQSYEQLNEYRDDCLEMNVDPENFRQQQLSDARLYRLLYIAVKEYHNCLSHYLKEHQIALPDLDTLVAYSEGHKEYSLP